MSNNLSHTGINFLSTSGSNKTKAQATFTKNIFTSRSSSLHQASQLSTLLQKETFLRNRMSDEERNLLPAYLKPATINKVKNNLEYQENFETAGDS